ncbi:MAG: hypothetical protein GWN29_04805 [Gammaproteobacteria bacterium]|nr:hypothetical protein [Gammaproteobacteria bacterium]NIW23925.1 hypothetical protein [Gammaproteobacteria bacterium]
METLRACYPHRLAREERWGDTVRVYWTHLSRFDADVAQRAFSRAWKAHPHWFPTLGQMVELCKTAERELRKPAPPAPTMPSDSETLDYGDYPDPWGTLSPRPWIRYGQLLARYHRWEARDDETQRELAAVRAALGIPDGVDDANAFVAGLTGG